jgi:hypothetical protein
MDPLENPGGEVTKAMFHCCAGRSESGNISAPDA